MSPPVEYDFASSGDTAEDRYTELSRDRTFFLQQAKSSAALTIPAAFPWNAEDNEASPSQNPSPWTSFGTYAVESLASKFMLAGFPPTQSFFRFEINESTLTDAYAESGNPGEIDNVRLEVQKALASRERAINKEFETGTYRIQLAEVFRQLVITGNCLVYQPPEGGGLEVHTLGNYVCQRDPRGNLIQIIIREGYRYASLPENVREMCPEAPEQRQQSGKDNDEIINVYTNIQVRDGYHHVNQECWGKPIPGTESKFKEDATPYMALRFTHTPESYGRGMVENYIGTLNSLAVIRRAVTEAAAAGARVVMLVKPNGSTKVRSLQNAPNGSYVIGDEQDIAAVQVGKGPDLAVAAQTAQELKQELSYAFLLNSAVQRDAERVTSAEIRYAARELESATGGAFSVMAQEIQLPIVLRIQNLLEKQGKIAKLPGDTVRPVVVTGLQAIGRSQELITVREMVGDLLSAAQLSPDIARYVDSQDLASKILLGHGVPEDGLLKTKEEVMQEAQAEAAAANKQQLVDRGMEAIPGLVQEAGSGMMQQVNGEVEQ